MLKNHNLAMVIQSASWGEFVRQIKYKTEWEGKNVIFIGRFDQVQRHAASAVTLNMT